MNRRNGGNEERLIIRCPYDNSERTSTGYTISRILTGADMVPSQSFWPPDRGLDGMRQFLETLHRQGYLSTPGMLPLLQPGHRQVNYYQEPMVTYPPQPWPQFDLSNMVQRMQGHPPDLMRYACEFALCPQSHCEEADGTQMERTSGSRILCAILAGLLRRVAGMRLMSMTFPCKGNGYGSCQAGGRLRGGQIGTVRAWK